MGILSFIEIEQINQEYLFDYDCCNSTIKTKLLEQIGRLKGYPDSESYNSIHKLYYTKIVEFYNSIYGLSKNEKNKLLKQFFDINPELIPENLKSFLKYKRIITSLSARR